MPPARLPEQALDDLARAWQRERRRVLRDPGPEAVHRLRTATRRLETAAAIASERLTAARAWWAEVAGPLAREPAWGLSLVEALRGKAGREAVHAIRIRVRELRYGLEWWDRLGQVASAPVVAWLRDAQDTLGRIRDYDRASKALSGPELRRSRTVVGIRGAAEIAHWPSVASQGDLLGSSPFEGNPP